MKGEASHLVVTQFRWLLERGVLDATWMVCGYVFEYDMMYSWDEFLIDGPMACPRSKT